MSDAGAQQQTLQSWLWTAKGYPLNLPPAGFFLIALRRFRDTMASLR